MTMDPVTHVEDVHHQHASVKTYLAIAGILTVLTIVELCIPYIPHAVVPVWLGIATLALLSIVKFALVVMFFMHLYYDSRLMTFLFVIGLLMATGTVMSTWALMNIHALQKPEPVVVTQVKMLPPDPKRGMVVIEEKACATCHTVQEIARARGTIGPALDGVADRAATRKPGMDARAYIEESITSPQAFVVPNYPASMPPDIRSALSDQEYADVVAYLLTLHEKK